MSGAQVLWQEQGPTLVDDDDPLLLSLPPASHHTKGPTALPRPQGGRPFCHTVSQGPALRIPV